MKTVKVKTNAGNIGFLAGFFGFALWGFFGNISSIDTQRTSLYDYLIHFEHSAFTVNGELETQDAIISLILVALVVGFISRFIFSLIAGTKLLSHPMHKADPNPNELKSR